MSGYLNVEDADLIVGKEFVMVRFGGDLDFLLGLSGQEDGEEQKCESALHLADSALRDGFARRKRMHGGGRWGVERKDQTFRQSKF